MKTMMLQSNEKLSKNRKICASRDYQPGDVIVQPENPLIHVVAREYKTLLCDHCLSRKTKIKGCVGCRQVGYCSRDCQAADWQAGHRWECAILRLEDCWDFLKRSRDALVHRLTLRTWLLWKHDDEQLRKAKVLESTGEKRSFVDLFSNAPVISFPEELKEVSGQLVTQFDRLGLIDKTSMKQVNELYQIWSRLMTNAFQMYDDAYRTMGVGCYLELAAFNHSCVPNAAQFPSGNGIMMGVRALSEIKKGDEVLISYKDLKLATEQRRVELAHQYEFLCHCSRCTSCAETEEAQKQEHAMVLKLKELHLKSQCMEEEVSKKRKHNVREVQLIEDLMKRKLDLEIEAYNVTGKLLQIPYHYQISKALTQVCLTVIQIHKSDTERTAKEKNQSNGSNGLKKRTEVLQDLLDLTREHLRVTHGTQHPLYKQIVEESNNNLYQQLSDE